MSRRGGSVAHFGGFAIFSGNDREPSRERRSTVALITIAKAAEQLLCKKNTLYSRQFRATLGLAAVKIGRSVKFDEQDIAEVIRRRKETHPPMTTGDDGGQ
jgi:predicted DNA-binding transcriptional regulator AlpA